MAVTCCKIFQGNFASLLFSASFFYIVRHNGRCKKGGRDLSAAIPVCYDVAFMRDTGLVVLGQTIIAIRIYRA